MASIALAAGLAAAGGVTSAVIGSNASSNAATQQAQSDQNAINEENLIYGENQTTLSPFINAGKSGLSSLMANAGNLPPAFTGVAPTFTAPTLAQAQQTPGYQFELQQGNKGILEGAAATGGAISGGTLKSLDQYGTNLADTTYNTIYNQALSGYGANLSTYQANLAQYAQSLAAQQQGFNQEYGLAGLGEGAASTLAGSAANTGNNIASLMQSAGNAQAAGTVGGANAITSGITGATNSITQAALLNQILNGGTQFNASTAPGAVLTGPAAGQLTEQILGASGGGPG